MTLIPNIYRSVEVKAPSIIERIQVPKIAISRGTDKIIKDRGTNKIIDDRGTVKMAITLKTILNMLFNTLSIT